MIDGYDLTDKETVIGLLKTHIGWCKESPSHEVSFGSYGPTLSQVIESAISMMGEKPKRNSNSGAKSNEPGESNVFTNSQELRFLADALCKSINEGHIRIDCDPGYPFEPVRLLHLADRIERDEKKPKRNCDLYDSEDEAKEAYEQLFYGTFQLKNCKDTIVAQIPGSPDFSTWLMTAVDGEQQKCLYDKKAAKLSEMKSVMDVVYAMTGVPPKLFYYNSDVRELGRRIEELYTKEKKSLVERNAKRNCDRFNSSEEAFAGYVDTFTKEELHDYEHGEGDFSDDYNVKMRFFEWLFQKCDGKDKKGESK